jgi:hypothetical protein
MALAKFRVGVRNCWALVPGLESRTPSLILDFRSEDLAGVRPRKERLDQMPC